MAGRSLTRASSLQDVRVWAQHRRLGAVLGSAGSLSATAVLTSGLGFVFWWLAARYASPAAVGLAAAAVSATTLLAALSMLGFGTLLIGEIAAGHPQQGALFTTALLVVGTCGGTLGAVFALIGPFMVSELRPLQVGAPMVALFALAAGGTAIGLLFDQLMVGLLRSELQLARNAVYAVAKLLLLLAAAPLLIADQALVVFATWPVGNLVSILAVLAVVVWRPVGIRLARPRLRLLRRVGGTALGHHAVNLALGAPALLLPVLVTALLSTTATAYFYTAWMIASVAFLPQTALAVTLYALGAREPSALVARVRLTMFLGLTEGVLAIAVIMVGAPYILSIFGPSYAVEASGPLRILVLAVLPIVIKTHFVALCRVRQRMGAAGKLVTLGAAVEVLAATVGAYLGGVPGVCIGWVAGMVLESVFMGSLVWRTLRS